MANDTANSEGLILAYNLFRHKDEVGLYCAVPQDRSIPAFLTDDKWDYARSLDVGELSVFDTAAVRASVTTDGFYLFHTRL